MRLPMRFPTESEARAFAKAEVNSHFAFSLSELDVPEGIYERLAPAPGQVALSRGGQLVWVFGVYQKLIELIGYRPFIVSVVDDHLEGVMMSGLNFDGSYRALTDLELIVHAELLG
jgi:hypothetical protein